MKDKSNNRFRVSVKDPRYLSGELVHVKKKMVFAYDKNGNEHWVWFKDKRLKSGELYEKNGNNKRQK